MNLIIYAHPGPASFNHAILEKVTGTLKEMGQEYDVIDLYAIGYDPVVSLEEMKGKLTEDTKGFQERIRRARIIYFIFPVFWFRAPAILEGFCDRVFTPGFAYKFIQVIGVYGYPKPLLKDKKVVTFITHGAPGLPVRTIYVNAVKYRFLLGFLSFCFNLFRCHIVQFWSVPFVSDKKRKSYLERIGRRVRRTSRIKKGQTPLLQKRQPEPVPGEE